MFEHAKFSVTNVTLRLNTSASADEVATALSGHHALHLLADQGSYVESATIVERRVIRLSARAPKPPVELV